MLLLLGVVTHKSDLFDVLLLDERVVLVRMHEEVMLFQAALIEVLLVAALKDAFENVSPGVFLVNLHVLLKI